MRVDLLTKEYPPFIYGGEVISSVLSPGVRVNSWSSVRESVIMDGAEVGRNTVVNRAILDKYVKVEEGAMVGIDPSTTASGASP